MTAHTEKTPEPKNKYKNMSVDKKKLEREKSTQNKTKKLPPVPAKFIKRFEANQALIEPLAKHWPRLKIEQGKKPLPLSVNIHETIYQLIQDNNMDITPQQVCFGLRAYTNRIAYIRAIAAGGDRFDLDGNKDGVIEPEHQAQAKERSDAFNKKHKKTKKTQEQKSKKTSTKNANSAPKTQVTVKKKTRRAPQR